MSGEPQYDGSVRYKGGIWLIIPINAKCCIPYAYKDRYFCVIVWYTSDNLKGLTYEEISFPDQHNIDY